MSGGRTEIACYSRACEIAGLSRSAWYRPLEVAPVPNAVWSVDFVHDTLYGGRRFRTLNVMDEGVRECLAIEIDTSLPGARLVRTLEQIKASQGVPNAIRCDNGPELIYNEERPHTSLGGLPPAAFREKVETENSTLEMSC